MPFPFIAVAMLAASAASAYGASKQASASKKASQTQMDFQREMSSTAHQREVKDLRLAGLNPILSATGGGGASTPSGAQPAQIPNIAGKTASSALAALQISQAVKKQQADIELTHNLSEKAAADTLVSEAAHDTERKRALNLESSSGLLNQQARLNQIQQVLESLAIPGAENTAIMEKALGALGKGVGPAKGAVSILQIIRDLLKGKK